MGVEGGFRLDLGLLGEISVYNTELGNPDDHWRAVWVNVNGDVGWDVWAARTAAEAQQVAEEWMRTACTEALAGLTSEAVPTVRPTDQTVPQSRGRK